MLDLRHITRIVFVCHGNICRSSMAECRMVQLLEQAGRTDIEVDSRATSTEELGNNIHPGARRSLQAHGVPIRNHVSTQLSRRDLQPGTLFVGADQANIRNIKRMLNLQDTDPSVVLLLDFANRPGQSIADPWYTGEFEETWNDVDAGCKGLLAQLTIDN